MADVTINYKDAAIATMDASGTKTLQTQGKYCEDDIEVVYARPSTPGGPTFSLFTATSSATNARSASILLFPNATDDKVYFAYITKSASTWVQNQFLIMMMTGKNRKGGFVRWRDGGYNVSNQIGDLYDAIIQPGDTFMICEADLVL